MIDLSYLTEEEQETIMAVLKRDALLKKAEERRVQNLQTTVRDRSQLKYLTGDWFYEIKQLRHQDRIHGSDIIMASLRHTHKPLTIRELSHILPEKSRFISSDNKDVFVPPVLRGFLEEPPSCASDERYQNQTCYENTQEVAVQQQRKNPFDSQLHASPRSKKHLSEALYRGRDWTQTMGRGYVGSSNPTLPAFSSKNMSSSKCLQRLTTECVLNAGEECTKNEKTLSVDGASSTASLFNAKHTNSSLSVPVLQQDGIEIDFTSEDNLGWRRNTGSSMSNLSLSSGMASNSSNEQVSGSIGSIYTPDSGDVEAQGSIQFAVNYIQKQGEFHMFVVHCRDLAVADTKRNRSDPYVKCYLIPDKTKLGKRKTTIKKKTLNPTYNEILTFNISMEVLKTLNLNISVWHNDTFGRNSFLGEMDLDLSEWDFDNTQINEYTLKNRVSTQTLTLSPSHLLDRKGQMRVALRFLTQMSHCERTSIETGEVQIWVKDGKNLPSDRGVTIDPFVKCTVLPDTSRKSRQKTRVVKRTANPMFNHTMVYNGFRPEDLREVCVELTVWDHDRLNNHYLGGMRLGLGTGKSYGVDVAWMDSTTNEAHLWQRMLQSGGEWVEDVLPLRMFVIAKSISK
ncbi:synaptotagmin-like protein 2 isoform X7 [Betta splendens]|uniref:Synaptotagmin-like protein 2 n=1 Tax=Betta splendens TaxID=158456 RepID=A0A6P7PEY0_BETSP|nr:synaptotagmin-like protein 2 isoform X7 [Betta splendens]